MERKTTRRKHFKNQNTKTTDQGQNWTEARGINFGCKI